MGNIPVLNSVKRLISIYLAICSFGLFCATVFCWLGECLPPLPSREHFEVYSLSVTMSAGADGAEVNKFYFENGPRYLECEIVGQLLEILLVVFKALQGCKNRVHCEASQQWFR